jgi:AmmeMemoRadiSam system protein B
MGLVAPHAGYVYSGPVAGCAFALVAGSVGTIRRVVLLGPSHFFTFPGFALPESSWFATPLGEHPVDDEAVAILSDNPRVRRWEEAHRDEHSLEVQLPFLTVTVGLVPVVPILTGAVGPWEVADVLERVWDPDTLVVVSSDLSHYLPYEEARAVDRGTADAMEDLDLDAVGPDRACGATGVQGLLAAARRRCLRVRCVDLRSSGDTAGSRRRVVGYGAFGVWAREA